MTRKKWSFLFTVCLMTALIGCGQKNSQVDKNNSEELNKLGQIQVISREEGSGTRDTFASLAGFNKDGADGIDKTVNTATIADSMDSVIETVNKNPSAIGYVSAGTTGIGGVKTLEINGEAVSDNKGKYPLTRSFYLAYSGTLNDVEQDFMTYVQSAGQEIVSGHYETIAKNATFLSNQSEGTIRIEGSTSMAALMKEIADAYMKMNTHATIQVTATDSTKGLNSVMSGNCDMAMSSRDLKDYEKELEESMKTIEEGDILTGTVISVDEKEVILDLKYYAEGVIPAENYSREPGFSLKDEVHEGDEVSATVVRKDDGQGNILLSRVEAVDVLAWDKLKELKESGEVLDVVVKGITNAGVIAYVEGVRGFIPASKLALNYVEDTEEYLNKPIQVQVLDVDKESKKLILSAKEILRAKAEEERKNKVSNLEIGLVTEGTVESLQPYGAFVDLGNGVSGLVHISQICEKRIRKPSEVLAVGDKVKVKVTAVKDGKLSLSIKEATDMMAKEVEEEKIEIPQSGEEATTSLGALFANIKLN